MLFSNFKIKDLNFKNRLVMAPMCMYSAKNDGVATNWHVIHYATRAIGGIGSIIIEATAVEPNGRISENDLGIWSDDHIPNLKAIVDEVHANNTLIGIQINHAGRKSKANEVIAPSAISFDKMPMPKEMTKQDINNVIQLFQDAATRAIKAGFDFIEIHGAHGYLISQFLSPLANKRTDDYGGSIINRMRFLKEIIDSIRTVYTKDKVLGLRLSVEDYLENGNHPEDFVEMINMIKSDIDFIDVSSGGVENVKINAFPGYQLEFARIIKEKTNIVVIGGGYIDNAKLAQFAVESNYADFVYLGRELLRNPYFPLFAAKSLSAETLWPIQYIRAK